MALAKCKECGHEVSKKAEKCPGCGSPLKKKSRPLGCGGLIVVAVLALWLFNMFFGSPNDQTTNSSVQSKSSSTEITLTDAMKTEVAAAIREAGFNCPKVKIAYAKGEDVYGTATKIFCGPADRDGVYEKAVFRLTFMANDMMKVEPWK